MGRQATTRANAESGPAEGEDADRVLARLPATTWDHRLSEILREAIGLLTPPKHASM